MDTKSSKTRASNRSVVLPSLPEHRSRQRSLEAFPVHAQLCEHLQDYEWADIKRKLVAKGNVEGLVLIDPNFLVPGFIPMNNFRTGRSATADLQLEDPSELSGQLINGKPEHYQEWVKGVARTKSDIIFTHLCNICELFDRFSDSLKNLTRLSLHFYILNPTVPSFCAKHFTNLCSISLDNCINLDDITLAKFAALEKLQHVNLSNCSVQESSMKHFLDSLRSDLKSLSLQNNVSLTGEFLSHPALSSLERLDIQGCWGITPESIISMATKVVPRLIELALNSGISDESMRAIVENFPQLEYLRIDFTGFYKFGRFGIEHITENTFHALANLTHLQELYIAHSTNFFNEHLQNILHSNPKLKSLKLHLRDQEHMTDNCIIGISEFCPDLTTFEAVHNKFVGHNTLFELGKLKKLEYLNLTGCVKVRNDHVSGLMLNTSTLRTIILDGCTELNELCASYLVRHAQIYTNIDRVTVSLVHTRLERGYLEEKLSRLPSNLVIRCSSQKLNKEHFNQFNGRTITHYKLDDYRFWDGYY